MGLTFLTTCSASQERRERLGRAGRAYAEQHLSRDVVLAEFEKTVLPHRQKQVLE